MATVSYQGRCWVLPSGQELILGRSDGCDVRLPDDGGLSRRAAVLSAAPDHVLIRNVSSSKPFVLRPRTGEDQIVGPGAATTSLPHHRFEVVLAGRLGDVAIQVDASAITRVAEPAAARSRSVATFTRPSDLTRGQHRIAIALCQPLLTLSGSAARPATYKEIADALNLSPHYVRKVIGDIRDNLTGYGVPGLQDEGDAPNGDFRLPLARWALWSGWVSRDDLHRDDSEH